LCGVALKNKAENDCLSTEKHWSDRWSQKEIKDITFNPNQPMFADLHRLFSRILPKDESLKFLEIGAFPGSYMWYFNKFFGYQVSGLEYVDWCCEQARHLLRVAGVEGNVIHGNLLTYQPHMQWDIVFSMGLIEHFSDTAMVVSKHLKLLRKGGYLVLGIPNHRGFYGSIMRMVDHEKYRVHNRMGYGDMLAALNETGQIEMLEGGYFGRLGFWATGIYQYFKPKGRLLYLLVRGPLWVLERVGRLLPNSKSLSPNIVIIARKLL